MVRGGLGGALVVCRALALCVVAGAGCNHDPLPFAPQGDGGVPDLASAPDLATSACRTHQILFAPLEDIQVVGPKAGRVGSSLLLRVAYSLRQGCDVAGDLDVRVMPGNATDFVVITMRTWRGDKECGPPTVVWRNLALGPDQGLGNQSLLLSDGAPGGTKMLRVELAKAPATDCAAFRQDQDPCEGDCQCQRSEPLSRCVMAPGTGEFRCRIPCAGDADCDPGLMGGASCGPAGAWQVCARCREGDACDCKVAGCGFGQVCSGVRCVPLRRDKAGSCGCDGECEVGRVCDQAKACVAPCTTSRDCVGATCMGGRCL